MAVVGRVPADYSDRLELRLDPRMRADAALKLILRPLLGTMEANRPWIADHPDPEFLHDFRVAVRRARAALGQLKGLIPDGVRGRRRGEFAWLGAVTGEPRDLDVYLEEFPTLARLLPARERAALEPLREHLTRARADAYRELAAALGGSRYRRLVVGLEAFLEQPLPARPRSPHALRPVREYAADRIWRAYRKLLRHGARITDQSPPEQLHELRKEAKKLRYLLEFFAGLFPPGKVRRALKALKRLQDNLGAYQDVHVQQTFLRERAGRLAAGLEDPTPALLALGMLIERLERRARACRAEFVRRFAAFASPEEQARYRRLFHPS